MMRGSRLAVTSAVIALLACGGTAVAAAPRDAKPTTLVSFAKQLGITKAGTKYAFEKDDRTSDTLRLTVKLPKAWDDRADSHFVAPDTHDEYGVGVRATTNADKFHNTTDVPGMRLTAAGLTPDELDQFDPAAAVSDNAPTGCRKHKIEPFDNGTYQGKVQTFDRCDGKRGHAKIVVSAVAPSPGVEILLSAQVLTKSDLKALDQILSTATVEKTSV